MAIDSRIALGYQMPEAPSRLNMLGQALQLEGLQRQNQLGAMQMKEQEAVAAEREALRNHLSGNPNLDTPEGQMGLYKVAPTQAGGILKSRADLTKEQALTKKAQVETEGAQLKQKHDAITFNLQALGAVTNPQQAQQWVSGGVQSGLISMQQAQAAVQAIPQDPQGFEQWKQRQMATGMTLAQQAEQAMKQREFGLKANNEIIGPDGKPNQTLIAAKQQIAKAGASSVSVNTGQKGYENESKLRNDFKSEPIYKDFADMKTAHAQIKSAITQGTPIADTAAATKIMKLLDPGSVVRESELAIAMAAAGKLDRLQNYVQMQISGNKLTPTQRKDFGSLADELMGAATQAYNAKRAEYAKFGQTYGLSEDVLGAPASAVAKSKDAPGNLSASEQTELEALRKRFKK